VRRIYHICGAPQSKSSAAILSFFKWDKIVLLKAISSHSYWFARSVRRFVQLGLKSLKWLLKQVKARGGGGAPRCEMMRAITTHQRCFLIVTVVHQLECFCCFQKYIVLISIVISSQLSLKCSRLGNVQHHEFLCGS
jgi:hypothetical protein